MKKYIFFNFVNGDEIVLILNKILSKLVNVQSTCSLTPYSIKTLQILRYIRKKLKTTKKKLFMYIYI